MAISVDTVYQKVLALANKEQRGYITPQEYLLLADQAQQLIFEQYFYDVDKSLDLLANNTEYSNRISEIEERLAPFKNTNVAMVGVSGSTMVLPTTLHRLGTVFYNDGTRSVKVEQVDAGEAEMMQQTALYAATQLRPIYVRRTANSIQFYPSSASPAYSTSTVNCNFIDTPVKPIWNFTVVNNQALYNSVGSVDFELHESEETDLVYKILEMAGVVLNKPGLVQIASNEETALIAKKQ